jgi:uncharacterized protein
MATSWAYFDTSVLVKRYVAEAGASRARRLLATRTCVSSTVAPVELASAVWRRCAAGNLTERQAEEILADLRQERRRWELVTLSGVVTERAEELVRVTGSRTLDALHLASALLFEASLSVSLPFVTADTRQADAAARLGLRVVRIH